MPHATVRGTAATAAVILAALAPQSPLGADDITEAEARAIAVDAYLYFYPLITMDVTRRQLTNANAENSEIGGAPNAFKNVQAFPSADMRAVVRPNFDTLYSSAWLDLTKEPVVVSAPDTGGRYYLLPMLDMWTDVFASPGWRTTGTAAANFLVTPPGWRVESGLPENMQHIAAPTPYVWVIGRTKTDGPADYDAVHKIQDGYKITPLSQWGKTPVAPSASVDPSVDMKTPPKVQVDTMPGDRYFAYAAELLKLHPPHITDEPIIARLKRIGFEAGKSFDPTSASAAAQQGLAGAPAAAQKLMQWKAPTLARVANGWSMNTDTMGVYGNFYLKRAMVAQLGLGANLAEDAVYPLNLADATGKPLDGAAAGYTLHFAKDGLPPAEAFWSVTLYDNDGFQVANPLNRFALSSWMPFKTNADGSLDLYFQNASPGADKEANWLPAPKGPFTLTMRIYAPKREVLTGQWDPPPLKPAE
ncbi:DUF1254 domain-containing protein [Hyphomicrobium sp. xq]|uniref:DUF1254 domain-containing protein n=1 Tax=Hyphomicrobium album TaxID=2665159 RepID=A0A6I3KP01_9HYPH|nr:DUF1254 domain-containing protein [Hyphomicrobium album]MTD95446.1 DUF1254 domain-containing protein [Hyphomicrobium album]